uniref:Uncharacterized protein n=1 Tax=Podoviridae sp. ctXSp1 TaxID=2825256 RepID=A0A8S5PYP9_9CAUD|nr:MAG TPA: hypothetical protein [Podoviridae sp. ctXSp1]
MMLRVWLADSYPCRMAGITVWWCPPLFVE